MHILVITFSVEKYIQYLQLLYQVRHLQLQFFAQLLGSGIRRGDIICRSMFVHPDHSAGDILTTASLLFYNPVRLQSSEHVLCVLTK